MTSKIITSTAITKLSIPPLIHLLLGTSVNTGSSEFGTASGLDTVAFRLGLG